MICLQYSRDDRFLISLSDFYECTLCIWSTNDYSIVTQAITDHPMHCARWNPFSANELATVGRNGSLYFWYLDDKNQEEMKLEVFKKHKLLYKV